MSTELITGVLLSAIVSPFVTEALKRLSWVNERLGAAINAAVLVGGYVVAWYFVRTPPELSTWIMWGLGAAGLSTAGHNVATKMGKTS